MDSRNRIFAGIALAAWLLLVVGGVAPARAQEEAAPSAQAEPEAAAGQPAEKPAEPKKKEVDYAKPMGPADDLNRGTPQGSMYGYIVASRAGDYEKAAEFLDLRQLPPHEAMRAAELARRLKVVLDSKLWIDFETLNAENAGWAEDGLPAWRDRLGTIASESGDVDILLQRIPREGDRVRIWKVAAETVERIDHLYEEFGPGWLEAYLPAVFFEYQTLDLWLWQWAGLVLFALLAYALSGVLAVVLIRLLAHVMGRRGGTLDERVVSVVRGPARLFVAVVLFALSAFPLDLPVDHLQWLRVPVRVLMIVAFTWLVFRFVDIGTLVTRQRLLRRGQEGLVPVLQPSQRIVKAIVFAFGALAVLANLGVNVTAAMAGLGVGGIAIALAAQKTIENLFGGMTLFADQPVRVGDFFRFGDQVGTVEEIGLRSTRVRTLDRTVLTVPNAEFSNLHLENFVTRDRMRLHTILGMRYETSSEQLRYLLARLRELLLEHPRITEDPARVRFVGFGAYSLDLEIFAYVNTSDWNDFLEVREDLFLRIIDIVEEAGTGFAFPSSTMYVGQDTGLSQDNRRQAEEQVRVWRREGELPFPRFSEGFVQEKANTLEWPPEGSPDSPRRVTGGATMEDGDNNS
jgi:MscS family membrane protein